MVRLEKADLESKEKLQKYAEVLHLSPDECGKKFSSLSELGV